MAFASASATIFLAEAFASFKRLFASVSADAAMSFANVSSVMIFPPILFTRLGEPNQLRHHCMNNGKAPRITMDSGNAVKIIAVPNFELSSASIPTAALPIAA